MRLFIRGGFAIALAAVVCAVPASEVEEEAGLP
jgi:hypothetical protein